MISKIDEELKDNLLKILNYIETNYDECLSYFQSNYFFPFYRIDFKVPKKKKKFFQFKDKIQIRKTGVIVVNGKTYEYENFREAISIVQRIFDRAIDMDNRKKLELDFLKKVADKLDD